MNNHRKCRFYGDIHGNTEWWLLEIVYSPYPTVQVGDFGIGFVANPITEDLADKHRFIRGNHDSPALCREQINYIPDGTVEGNMMFIGGASSIDKQWRTPGVSWWEDEELSYDELNRLISVYEVAQPEIMVTHECPDRLADHFLALMGRKKFEDKSRTRQAFDSMFDIHKPKIWIFGHWHFDLDIIFEGTRFICLNEGSSVDVNLDTCEVLNFKQNGWRM